MEGLIQKKDVKKDRRRHCCCRCKRDVTSANFKAPTLSEREVLTTEEVDWASLEYGFKKNSKRILYGKYAR